MRGVPKRPRPAPTINGDSALIPLYGRGNVVRAYATVDAEDAAWASQWRWHLSKNRAVIRNHNDGVRKYMVYLHRELLGLPHRKEALVGDHIDRDPLNNRRRNLRAIPQHGNMQNITAHSRAGLRGVRFHAPSGQWQARVKHDGKTYHLGLFRTAEEAGEAARIGRARFLPYAVD